MTREKVTYRDNLERIIEFFPGKEMLRVYEVATFTGIDKRTVSKIFPFKNKFISIATLARCMCGE